MQEVLDKEGWKLICGSVSVYYRLLQKESEAEADCISFQLYLPLKGYYGRRIFRAKFEKEKKKV